MHSLYTQEIKQYVNSRDWPKGLMFDVREKYDPAPHLNLVFFRDNWLELTFDEQMKTTGIVKEVMDKLWNDGVPTYVGRMEHIDA